MERHFRLLLLLFAALPALAQAQFATDDGPTATATARDTLAADSLAGETYTEPALPLLDLGAPGLDGCAPWDYGLYGPAWRLHEGFNAQFALSLTAAFGRGAPSGVGFGQSAALAYALPLGKRFDMAAGVYAAHLDWGGYQRTEGGFAALLRYRLTDRVSLYAYGTKRFLPSHNLRQDFFPLYLPAPKDRLGAMAEFKIGNNAMIQVSVERNSY